MNWAAIAAFSSLFGVIVMVVSVAYMSGQFTQQIKDNKDKTAEHSLTLKEHSEKLEEHGEKISGITEWKNGVQIGARIGPSQPSV